MDGEVDVIGKGAIGDVDALGNGVPDTKLQELRLVAKSEVIHEVDLKLSLCPSLDLRKLPSIVHKPDIHVGQWFPIARRLRPIINTSRGFFWWALVLIYRLEPYHQRITSKIDSSERKQCSPAIGLILRRCHVGMFKPLLFMWA